MMILRYVMTGVLFLSFLASGSVRAEESNDDDKMEDLNLFEVKQQWDFKPGAEFPPGGKGEFRVEEMEGERVGVLAYNFSEGGGYVAGSITIFVPTDVEEIRFRVKSSEPQNIVVRVYDSSYQIHGWQLSYTQAEEWQWLRCSLNKTADYHLQGYNDGVFNYPLKAFMLGVLVKKGANDSGEVYFSKVRVLKK
jgi:hypothetical protein